MTSTRWLRFVAPLAFAFLANAASGQQSETPDGLVKVRSRLMELAWVLPGADFRPYTKVNISQTQVAFRNGWMKDYNLSARLGQEITQEQANKIMAAAQTNFDQVFRDEFTKAGYQVVTTTGPDVLRVNSSIVDLDVNVPLGDSTGQTTWIISAGDAALIVEVRDTVTNAILARVADRRETANLGRQIATTATNIYDFRLLFDLWARICTKGMGALKAASPIPKNLQPNQSL